MRSPSKPSRLTAIGSSNVREDSHLKGSVIPISSHPQSLTRIEKNRALISAAHAGDEQAIIDIVRQYRTDLHALNAIKAISGISDVWSRVDLLLDVFCALLPRQRQSRIIFDVLQKEAIKSQDDAIIKHIVKEILSASRIVFGNNVETTDLGDTHKNQLLDLLGHISDPFARASGFTSNAKYFKHRTLIALHCLDAIEQVTNEFELLRIEREFTENFASEILNKEVSDRFLSLKIRALAASEKVQVSKIKYLDKDDKISDVFSDSSKPSKEPGIRPVRPVPRLSPESIVFLKDRALARSWSKRSDFGYQWNTSPLDFILYEYKGWLKKGLTRLELRSIDKALSRRLDTWVREPGNSIPAGVLGTVEPTPATQLKRENDRIRKRIYRSKKTLSIQ